jgi:hypothetical protein
MRLRRRLTCRPRGIVFALQPVLDCNNTLVGVGSFNLRWRPHRPPLHSDPHDDYEVDAGLDTTEHDGLLNVRSDMLNLSHLAQPVACTNTVSRHSLLNMNTNKLSYNMVAASTSQSSRSKPQSIQIGIGQKVHGRGR